jgi:hypothetical protein
MWCRGTVQTAVLASRKGRPYKRSKSATTVFDHTILYVPAEARRRGLARGPLGRGLAQRFDLSLGGGQLVLQARTRGSLLCRLLFRLPPPAPPPPPPLASLAAAGEWGRRGRGAPQSPSPSWPCRRASYLPATPRYWAARGSSAHPPTADSALRRLSRPGDPRRDGVASILDHRLDEIIHRRLPRCNTAPQSLRSPCLTGRGEAAGRTCWNTP